MKNKLSEKSIAEFMKGDFSKCISEKLLLALDGERIKNDSDYIDAKLTWSKGVKQGEAFIQVKIIVTTDRKQIE